MGWWTRTMRLVTELDCVIETEIQIVDTETETTEATDEVADQ